MKKTLSLLLLTVLLAVQVFALSSCKKETIVEMQISVPNGVSGTVELKLDPDAAPETTANFVQLAKSGFYDGLTFHRIMENSMVQGGDPSADGTGGSDKNIKGEFAANGFDNPIRHERGVISMARRGNPYYDSASSQFFICVADSFFLDGQYAAFGRVTKGMEIIDAMVDYVGTEGISRDPASATLTIKKQQPVIVKVTVK